MDEEDVEPVLGAIGRREQLDTVVVELVVESLISNVAHPVECEFRVSLLEQDRLDLETVLARFVVVQCCTR